MSLYASHCVAAAVCYCILYFESCHLFTHQPFAWPHLRGDVDFEGRTENAVNDMAKYIFNIDQNCALNHFDS